MAKSKVKKNPVNNRRLMSRRTRSAIFWVIEILAALFLSLLFCVGFCYQVPVQDASMSTTLETGDSVLVNRVVKKAGSIARGDVIAYREGSGDKSDIHIKRVIGLPGETISIHDGIIVINGESYIEDRDLPKIVNAGLAKNDITLGRDEYFVLGDNRNNSEDSRFADVGNIAGQSVIGRVWFRISPRESLGFVR
ncbi:MAG: signal peptidase I [Lachnospiraceae bacterium]|nr:signal peptidase I [Lachnospiraceae bacterium]